MKSVEATGKKLDDAIKSGLEQLGATIDDVTVEILCSGGFFRKAHVRLTLDEETAEVTKNAKEEVPSVTEQPVPEKREKREHPERRQQDRKERVGKQENRKSPAQAEQKDSKPAEKMQKAPEEVKEIKPVDPAQAELAKNYLAELLEKMGVEATLEMTLENGSVDIEIETEDSTVIGHHGEVLDSMQQLCKRAVEEGADKHLQVNLDCKGYRDQREKTLVSMANRMAAKAIKTGRKVVLEPMNNTQRKIIHATLNDNDKVFTRSEGHEPNRRVVIIPKRNGHKRYDKGGRREESPVADANVQE